MGGTEIDCLALPCLPGPPPVREVTEEIAFAPIPPLMPRFDRYDSAPEYARRARLRSEYAAVYCADTQCPTAWTCILELATK